MAWLTDEERAENARRDNESKTRGFRSAHEESQARLKVRRDALVNSARLKLSAAELQAIKQKARDTKPWEW